MGILTQQQANKLASHLESVGIKIDTSTLIQLIDGTNTWHQTNNLFRPEDTQPKVHINSQINAAGILVNYKDFKGDGENSGHWNCKHDTNHPAPIPTNTPAPAQPKQDFNALYNHYKENEPKPKTHPYAKSKGIGIAFDSIVTLDDNRNLIIPLYRDNGIVGLQIITTDTKKFMYGSSTKGAYLHYPALQENTTIIYVCEGWADGKHLNTSTTCNVYIAFSVGQLLSIITHVQSQNLGYEIVLVADNDADKDNNIGLTTAKKVQAQTGCSLIIPPAGKDVSDIYRDGNEHAVLQLVSFPYRVSVLPDTPLDLPNMVSVLPDTPLDTRLQEYDTRFDGLYHKNFWLSQKITPIALTADIDRKNHGLAITFVDKRNRTVTTNVSMEELYASPSKEIARLGGLGLEVSHNANTHRILAHWLGLVTPPKDRIIIDRLGFIDNTNIYISPDKTYGDTENNYFFNGNNPRDIGMIKSNGNLIEWWDHILSKCTDSSRLLFSLLLGFTAPLLSRLGKQGYGVHFWGETTKGKTTLARVASSIYGHGKKYTSTWGETLTALETVIYLRNDALLVLDDTSDRRTGVLNSAIYMIANGRGDGRGLPSGERRESKTWTTLAISTGEASIKELYFQDTHKMSMPEGADMRMISIPIEAGEGVFEHSNNPQEVSTNLLLNTQKYYGAAGNKWITYLCQQQDIRKRYNAFVANKTHTAQYGTLTPQAGRVMDLFELTAFVANEIVEARIVPEKMQETFQASVVTCWDEWTKNDEGAGNRNLTQLLERLDTCIETRGYNSFESRAKGAEQITRDFLGYNTLISRKSGERVLDSSIPFDEELHYDVYMFTISAFRTEIKGTLDTRRALHYLLQERRLLLDHRENKTQDTSNKQYFQWRINIRNRTQRLYALLPQDTIITKE